MCIYKAEHTILWASQNDWQFWVKTNTRDVLSMSLKCLNTSFILKMHKKKISHYFNQYALQNYPPQTKVKDKKRKTFALQDTCLEGH